MYTYISDIYNRGRAGGAQGGRVGPRRFAVQDGLPPRPVYLGRGGSLLHYVYIYIRM